MGWFGGKSDAMKSRARFKAGPIHIVVQKRDEDRKLTPEQVKQKELQNLGLGSKREPPGPLWRPKK